MDLFLDVIRPALVCASLLAPLAGMAQNDPLYRLSDGRPVAPLDRFQDCDACPEMIALPLGSFMMGAKRGESRNPFDWFGKDATGGFRQPGEINIKPSEHPRHPVEMDLPYAIGRNEVTHAEWMACVEEGGCAHSPDHSVLVFRKGHVPLGPDHPVINVSYLDALEYVAWLNARIGADVYRLPTEAEWEYAARAGTETRFAQGEELTSEQANFSGSGTEQLRQFTHPEGMPELINRAKPVPVGDLDAANGWGVRHMSGNVQELTQSCWTETLPGLASASAYLELSQSQAVCERRTSKGGDFRTAMDYTRLAAKMRPKETTRRNFQGFRVVRSLYAK